MDLHGDRASDLLPPVTVDQRLHSCKPTPNDVMHAPNHSDHQEMLHPQYINLQRLQDHLPKVQLDSLSNDLLSHQVVEISSTGSIVSPNSTANYYGEDLLGNDLTEEDKRLAAALVAVQLVHQQKQNTLLTSELLNSKSMAPLSPFTPSTVDKPGMAAMVTSYIQAFEEETAAQNLLEPSPAAHDRNKFCSQPLPDLRLPPLPPLKKVLSTQNLLRSKSKKSFLEEELESDTIKNCMEENLKLPKMVHIGMSVDEPCLEDLDSDYEIDNESKTSRRSLPHKKRIPRKLKTQPQRNIHSKCYKCQKCGDSFSNQSSFFNHRSQHSNPPKRSNSFSCEICPFQSPNQVQFFEHLKTHYEPKSAVESVIQTDLQDCNNDTVPELIGSFNLKPDDPKKTYDQLLLPNMASTCEQCGKSFKRQRAYISHKETAHSNTVEEFSEPEDMMEGIRHVVNIQTDCPDDENHEKQSKEEKSLAPPQQQNNVDTQTKSLSQSDSFDESTPDSEKDKKAKLKTLSCPHCPKEYVHKNSYLYHIRSHTGKRPHQCDVCGKGFFASNALKVHFRTHTGVRPYKCATCGRGFRQWGDLKDHITSLHSNIKQYQCEFCGKDFARKYSLIVHRRIHTNERNYICEFCSKTFRASSYLVKHRRIHTGEKPHECDICHKPFRVKSDLKRHRNTHNKARRLTSATAPAGLVVSEDQAAPVETTQPLICPQVNHMNATTQDDNPPEFILPDVSPSPLNLMRTDATDGLTYAREGVTLDRDQNTLYVWLPTGADSILSDE